MLRRFTYVLLFLPLMLLTAVFLVLFIPLQLCMYICTGNGHGVWADKRIEGTWNKLAAFRDRNNGRIELN